MRNEPNGNSTGEAKQLSAQHKGKQTSTEFNLTKGRRTGELSMWINN